MDRWNNFQHEWFNHTTLHPVGTAALVVFVVLALFLPRRYAFVPIFLTACFISSAQRIALEGLDLTFLRILTIVLMGRIFARGEHRGFSFRPIDMAIIAWTLLSAVVYVIREASTGALIYKFGASLDVLGTYFLFRILIRSWEDVDRMVFCFIVISIPLAVSFLIEKHSGINSFAIFGGLPQHTKVRMGKLRCQGPFPHAIMAGCFWVSLLPLIIPTWWRSRRRRKWTVIGTVASTVIIITCESSTPMLGVGFGLVAVAFFPLRRYLRPIRWVVLACAIVTHLAMNRGIWFLIARVDVVGGSTGYHRAFLIDQAVSRFSEWALLGTNATGLWGFNLMDVTNQYILEGVRGGFLSIVLFIVVIAYAFQGIGRMIRQNRKDRFRLYASWGLGVAMFAHCWMFIAVSYFGQIWVVWYLTLAIVGSLAPVRSARRVRQPARRTSPPLAHAV